MPRIEIIPAGWETSKEKSQGDGTPTIDVCMDCALEFSEGECVSGEMINALSENGVTVGADDVVGSLDVSHPPYDDDPIDCDCCGDELMAIDD